MSKEDLRQQIDKIDDQILRLLNRRAKVALETLKFKKECCDPVRERAIQERLSRQNKGPLPEKSLRAIYREVISACRDLQKPISVAFLGPQATFSHSAAIAVFGTSIVEHQCADIDGVFDEVEKGLADFGMAPIENSTEGVISSSLDRIAESPVMVCGEVYVEVALCLLSCAKSIDKIKKIYTHIKPLEQCGEWVKAQWRKWEIVQVSSSGEAARLARGSATAGAIASRLAAQIYGLNILEERIENIRDNRTRFLVIGKTSMPPTGKDKTSVVFSVRHEAGTLYRALKAFEKYEVNLTMIQARPSRKAPWEYIFFVDMQGHADEKNIKLALDEMKKQTIYMKILGSYPEAGR
ncbi:MAG: prephenate dehydratase [bacterium]